MNISAKLTSKKQQEIQMALPPSCAALLLPSPAPSANSRMMPKYRTIRSFAWGSWVLRQMQKASTPLRRSPMHMVLAKA